MSIVTIPNASNPITPFTPGLTFGGGAVGMTFSARSGSYVKVGPLVFFRIDFTLSAKGSSTGSAVITGLPLAAGATADFASTAFGYIANLSSITGQVLSNLAPNLTSLALSQVVSGSTPSDLTHANFGASSRLILSGWYTV
jgi:hypothetical protein